MAQRHLYWQAVGLPGLEHLQIEENSQGIVADGLILRHEGDAGRRLHYHLRCDPQWRVQSLEVRLLDQPDDPLIITSDGAGHWANDRGQPIPALDGCTDVDVSWTPFTNTLPIRRLGLKPGEARSIDVVFIDPPALHAQQMAQRYTNLDANGHLYRYESVVSGFTADLQVDDKGFVIDYPGLWQRIYPDRTQEK
jgi:hypothetical protein